MLGVGGQRLKGMFFHVVMTIRACLIIALSIFGTSCDDSLDRFQSGVDVISVDSDDLEMNTAMEEARKAFPEFWSEVSVDQQRVIPALTLSLVKAYFFDDSNPDGGEHIWVDSVSFDGEKISGILMSQPRSLRSVAIGELVQFPVRQLSDWLLVGNGKVRGAYTVQILRARMNDDERIAHDANYPFEFPSLK